MPEMTMGRNRLLLIVAGLMLALFVSAALVSGYKGRSMTMTQLFESALAVFGIRTAEEPAYEVIDRLGEVEIRRYGPRFAAETTVAADGPNAMNQAFFILAGYIFGGNARNQAIAMTAPVALEGGQKIAMTAPVVMQGAADGDLTMRFFLPAAITQANAPEPTDKRVRLVTVPEETIAALRFTGSWSEASLAARKQELLAALKGSRWSEAAQPFTQLYDPPFTIPFLRRNEVALAVTPTEQK
jgi:SOUL heme-binding protein